MYYRVYLTKDVPIAVGCLSLVLRQRLLDLLGLEDPTVESGFDPNSAEEVAKARDLTLQAEEIFAGKPSAEWFEILEQWGVPAGPVKFSEELSRGSADSGQRVVDGNGPSGCRNGENDGPAGQVQRRPTAGPGGSAGLGATF